jgi:uncharacterized protein (TIGR02001 family)
MKLNLMAAGMAAALAFGSYAAPALADGEESAGPLTGSITLTTDYRFRGVSQTDTGPAVQASIDYAHDSGVYVGIWASNIDFTPFGDPDSQVEIDFTAGFDFAVSDQTTIGAKAVYYWYADSDVPSGDPEYSYYEIFGSVSHNIGKVTLTGEIAWTDNTFAESGEATAATGGFEVLFWKELWVFDGGVVGSIHGGYQWFEEDFLTDYGYWDVGMTATAGNFDFDARYIDAGNCGTDEVCDGAFVFSATMNIGG